MTIAATPNAFCKDLAVEHGVKKAIILNYIGYCQEVNEVQSQSLFYGLPYVRLTKSTIKEFFPYFNYSTVKRWLNELEEDGVISSIQPLKSQHDHTKFYHFAESYNLREKRVRL